MGNWKVYEEILPVKEQTVWILKNDSDETYSDYRDKIMRFNRKDLAEETAKLLNQR